MSEIQLTNPSKFSIHLRENIHSLFPIETEQIIKLNNENYFKEDFYLTLYGTFIVFGWKITKKGLVKVDPVEKIPFDLVKHILVSLNILDENYFSVLFILILCQNIFNYACKEQINWKTFEAWLQTQEYISLKYLKFIKYRWKITDTYTREEIYFFFLSKIKVTDGEKSKEYLLNSSITSYENKFKKLKNVPEIQEIFPDLKLEGKTIINILEKGSLKNINLEFKVNKLDDKLYDFSQGNWWVLFNFEIHLNFPEMLYFSQTKEKVKIMTNLLDSSKDNFKNFINIPTVSVNIPPSRKEFISIFNLYYSGFMMAKILGAENINSKCPILSNIFGNVYQYTVQMLAASSVGVNIIFWGEIHDSSFDYAVKIIRERQVLNLISVLPFHGLNNSGSSCYMDSALFSLLYKYIPTVTEKILRKSVGENLKPIQNELIRIQRSIQGTSEVDTCSDFRRLLRNIPGGKEFSGKEEQDAGEFLFFILNLFQVSGAVTKNTVYGTNDTGENPKVTVTSSIVDQNASVVNFVDSFSLGLSPANSNISDFLIKRSDVELDSPLKFEGMEFQRKLTKEEVISTPDFYIFYLQRADPITNTVLTKPILPNEQIRIGDKILELYSIVIHTGEINSGHYLVYFKHKHSIKIENNKFETDNWYIYNDVTQRIRKIGEFDTMLNRKPNPTSRGIIYFYS